MWAVVATAPYLGLIEILWIHQSSHVIFIFLCSFSKSFRKCMLRACKSISMSSYQSERYPPPQASASDGRHAFASSKKKVGHFSATSQRIHVTTYSISSMMSSSLSTGDMMYSRSICGGAGGGRESSPSSSWKDVFFGIFDFNGPWSFDSYMSVFLVIAGIFRGHCWLLFGCYWRL